MYEIQLVKTYTQGVKSRKMLVINDDDSLCSRVWCGVVDVVLMIHLLLSCVVEWISDHGQLFLMLFVDRCCCELFSFLIDKKFTNHLQQCII